MPSYYIKLIGVISLLVLDAVLATFFASGRARI